MKADPIGSTELLDQWKRAGHRPRERATGVVSVRVRCREAASDSVRFDAFLRDVVNRLKDHGRTDVHLTSLVDEATATLSVNVPDRRAETATAFMIDIILALDATQEGKAGWPAAYEVLAIQTRSLRR